MFVCAHTTLPAIEWEYELMMRFVAEEYAMGNYLCRNFLFAFHYTHTAHSTSGRTGFHQVNNFYFSLNESNHHLYVSWSQYIMKRWTSNGLSSLSFGVICVLCAFNRQCGAIAHSGAFCAIDHRINSRYHYNRAAACATNRCHIPQ